MAIQVLPIFRRLLMDSFLSHFRCRFLHDDIVFQLSSLFQLSAAFGFRFSSPRQFRYFHMLLMIFFADFDYAFMMSFFPTRWMPYYIDVSLR